MTRPSTVTATDAEETRRAYPRVAEVPFGMDEHVPNVPVLDLAQGKRGWVADALRRAAHRTIVREEAEALERLRTTAQQSEKGADA